MKNAVDKLTGLNRPLSWGYASNRFVLGLTLIFFITQLVLRRDWSLHGLWLVVAATVGVFVSWALGRELDPGDPGTAAWSAVATALSLLVLPTALYPVGMTISGILMLAARATARTTGRGLTPMDIGTFVVATPIAVVVAQAPVWGLAVPIALAVALEAWRAHLPQYLWGALAALLGGVLAWWISPPFIAVSGPIWLGVVVGAGLVLLLWLRNTPQSAADNGAPLGASALGWARALVVLGSLLSIAAVGFGPLLGVGWVGGCLGIRLALARRLQANPKG